MVQHLTLLRSVLRPVGVHGKRAKLVVDGVSRHGMSQNSPGMDRSRQSGRVENSPLDRGLVECSAFAALPVTHRGCSTGAASDAVEERLEVQTEVSVTAHHVPHLRRRGLPFDLGYCLAVPTGVGFVARSRLSMSLPTGSGQRVEHVLGVAPQLVKSCDITRSQRRAVNGSCRDVDVNASGVARPYGTLRQIPKLPDLRQAERELIHVPSL